MDTLRPGDFPIGSPESRAAARMLAANRQNTRERIEFVSHLHEPWRGEGPEPEGWNSELRIGPWQDCGDTLFRFVYVPSGMSADVPRKIIGN
jgi:hypothetical protein